MKSLIYWVFSTLLIIFIFATFLFIGGNIHESGISFSKVWSWLFILLGIAFEVGASHRLRGFWRPVVSKPNQKETIDQDASTSFDTSFLMLRILGVSLMMGGITYNVTAWDGALVWSLLIPVFLFRLLFIKKRDDESRS